MKAAAALIVALAASAQTFAATPQARSLERSAEGAAPAPSEQRQATYARDNAATTVKEGGKSHGVDASAKSTQPLEYRSAKPPQSAKAAYFRIYDAGVTLLEDRDGDGYHREFKLRFDADSFIGDALVYARLYIRRVGSFDDWQLYRTTDDFWIFGTSGSDDYYVTTQLNAGFPTAEYDILIDLYESGYSGVVATLSPSDDASLGYIPLEEAGLDAAIEISGFSIDHVATTLITDNDRDGYYSRFRISFDPNSASGVRYAYAVVWVRPAGGAWIKEHETADFPVDPSGSADTYSFTAEWKSGYPTGDYDVQIDMYDAATGLLAATAGSEWSQLAMLPLEDRGRDAYASSPGSGSGYTSTSSREGGGAFVWLWLLPIGALYLARRYLTRRIAIRIQVKQRHYK